jgi:hypothetical protein
MSAPQRAYRPKDFTKHYGIGRTKLWQEIRAGRLPARKAGRAVIILHEDAERWAQSLPMVTP